MNEQWHETTASYRREKRRVRTVEILRTVAEGEMLHPGALTGPRRTRNLVIPRHVAMYLCKKYTAATFTMIGNTFGGRDHSTVIIAINNVHRWPLEIERIEAYVCDALKIDRVGGNNA